MTIFLAVALAACDDDDGLDPVESEPYKIASLQINGEGTSYPWAPGDQHLTNWLEDALHASHRGISRSQDGMEMNLTVHHRIELQELQRGARLVINIDAIAERGLVDSESPMVTVRARARFRHLLARGAPSESVLYALSRTMTQQAVDDVVQQLRLRARVRQMSPAELSRWIDDDEIDANVRRYAIRRALIYRPPHLEPTLVNVVDHGDDEVAPAAARALFELESDRAPHALMNVAQSLSRDGDYDRLLNLLPMLGELDEPWIALYLETVADAHGVARVRARARSVVGERGGE